MVYNKLNNKVSNCDNFWHSQYPYYASSKDGFISHLTYLVQPPYLGKSQNTENDKFSRKQLICLWINNVDQCFIYTRFLIQVSVRLSHNKWFDLIWFDLKCLKCRPCARTHALSHCLSKINAADHPTLQRGTASDRRCYLLPHTRCFTTPQTL